MKLSDAYVYITEPVEDRVRIPTKLLFEIYDKKRGVIFHTSRGDVYVPAFTFSFTSGERLSFMFDSITEYEWATFGIEESSEILTPWDKKLISYFHIDWYNKLRIFLNSGSFVSIMKELALLRQTQNVLPATNAEVFKPFLEYPSVIPENLTTAIGFEDEHIQLWQPLISYIRFYDTKRSTRDVSRVHD